MGDEPCDLRLNRFACPWKGLFLNEQGIDPGFWERRDFWRVWGTLAAVTVEGPSHLARLTEVIRRYL